MDKSTFLQFKEAMDRHFEQFEQDTAQERERIDHQLDEIRATTSGFDVAREQNPDVVDDVSYARFAQFKEFMSGKVEQLHQQIHESSERNTRLVQAYYLVSQEHSQILHQRVSEYESQKAEEAAWEAEVQERILDARIGELPELHQFSDARSDRSDDLRCCYGNVKTDLEVLEALATTRQYILDGLGISLSDVESTFEDRYKLHPSVLKNSSRVVPKEVKRLINLRSNVTYLQHPYWTEHVELRDEIESECSKLIDRWLYPAEDQTYSTEETEQAVDDLYQLYFKMLS